ncbi:MAG TPA: hypothetical protein VGR57_12085 [Ktedonobacterales bacterium]|nr:hypothetical protein [Ktedonobacterales bacterium]
MEWVIEILVLVSIALSAGFLIHAVFDSREHWSTMQDAPGFALWEQVRRLLWRLWICIFAGLFLASDIGAHVGWPPELNLDLVLLALATPGVFGIIAEFAERRLLPQRQTTPARPPSPARTRARQRPRMVS